MTTALATLSTQLAAKFDMGDGRDVADILKATAFKGGTTQVSDAQMTALLVVANQYGLNPFTREIFAFPDKGGIVPVVGVDGWARILNDHPQFDGMEYEQDDEKCTCIIFRKDRSHAIKVTEYMAECKRTTQPWQSHPRRMLRHKATIQCARLAFGFCGIYDQDEAERIIERDMGTIDGSTGEIIQKKQEQKELPDYTDEQMDLNIDKWQAAINEGKTTPKRIIAMVSTKFKLNDGQAATIRGMKKEGAVDPFIAEMEAAEQKEAA